MYKRIIQSFCLLGLVSSIAHSASSSGKDTINQCYNKFALCAATDCKIMKGTSQATCECPVYIGRNFSTLDCQDLKNPPPGKVYSTYSPRHLLASSDQGVGAKKSFEPGSFCHVGAASGTQQYQYANCFDVLCSEHGKQATCECPVTTTQPGSKEAFMIQSNNCEEAVQVCQKFGQAGSGIAINSAPAAFGTKIVQTSLKSYGQNINKDMFCTPKDKLRILAQDKGLHPLRKVLKGKDTKIEFLADHKRVKVHHTKMAHTEFYCIQGCNKPEDCRASEGPPELKSKWVCNNTNGACAGTCHQKRMTSSPKDLKD